MREKTKKKKIDVEQAGIWLVFLSHYTSYLYFFCISVYWSSRMNSKTAKSFSTKTLNAFLKPFSKSLPPANFRY